MMEPQEGHGNQEQDQYEQTEGSPKDVAPLSGEQWRTKREKCKHWLLKVNCFNHDRQGIYKDGDAYFCFTEIDKCYMYVKYIHQR